LKKALLKKLQPRHGFKTVPQFNKKDNNKNPTFTKKTTPTPKNFP